MIGSMYLSGKANTLLTAYDLGGRLQSVVKTAVVRWRSAWLSKKPPKPAGLFHYQLTIREICVEAI
jgi:hypothetical protein